MAREKKEKKRRVKHATVRGADWIYNCPFKRTDRPGGKWRYRRRHIQTGRVETHTLQYEDGTSPSGIQEARDLIQQIADDERAKAKEAEENPERVEIEDSRAPGQPSPPSRTSS